MSIGALIIGLVIGWFACKLMANKPIKSMEDARASASQMIDAAVESTSAAGTAAARATEGLAAKAAASAGSAAQKAADVINSGAQKLSPGEQPAQETPTQNNPAETIAALQAEVEQLRRQIDQIQDPTK
ncbi:MAG: hypothetical protein WA888_09125 [Burkholderiaceae bacterium]